MVQLKDSLPVYFTDIYEVDAILGVVSKEIDRLYGVIYAAFDNLLVCPPSGGDFFYLRFTYHFRRR